MADWFAKGGFIPDGRKVVEQLVSEGYCTDPLHPQGSDWRRAMLRNPQSRYKQGRATVMENALLKVERFRDGEAEIIGFEERMHNTNPGARNALGRTQRSSAKAGLVGLGTLGALVVRGLPGQPFAGAVFAIGGGKGMDDGMRASVWARRNQLRGVHVTLSVLRRGHQGCTAASAVRGFQTGGNMSDQPVSLEFIGRRLDTFQHDLADVRRRMAAMTDRFGFLELRIGGIEQRISGLETRFGQLEVRIDRMTERYSGQEAALARQEAALARVLLLLEGSKEGS